MPHDPDILEGKKKNLEKNLCVCWLIEMVDSFIALDVG